MWILPFPEFIPTVEESNRLVMQALRRYKDHPDVERRRKIMESCGL
ncbi:MAG: hypothetical protein QM368_06925 [Bacillota bacterium]|nr:hypothetical protein [Bacillota bacterium]HHU30274.1 hypothetical protein [Bacillota bacterium]